MYELKGEELVNPPWNHDNLDEWLYRPVKIRGRPVHRLEMHFDKPRLNHEGGFVFVPVVTQEDEECTLESRKGLIVGLGWSPERYRHVQQRPRWENTWDYQEFTGIVTTNEELQVGKKQPNIANEQLFKISRTVLS